MMISARLVQALNDEINLEVFAHQQYLAMASWFELQSLDQVAEFFYDQAEEEKEHGLKILRYLAETGAAIRYGAIPAPRQDFATALEVAELFLAQEENVTQQFFKMAKLAGEDGDYITLEFIQWFIAEQREEMATAGKFVDIVKLSGDNLLHLELAMHRAFREE